MGNTVLLASNVVSLYMRKFDIDDVADNLDVILKLEMSYVLFGIQSTPRSSPLSNPVPVDVDEKSVDIVPPRDNTLGVPSKNNLVLSEHRNRNATGFGVCSPHVEPVVVDDTVPCFEFQFPLLANERKLITVGDVNVSNLNTTPSFEPVDIV